MWHSKRIWSKPVIVESVEDLAYKLSQQTWTGCQSFLLVIAGEKPLYFLNDSIGTNGSQEYAPLINEGENFYQVESITFSWCTPEEAEREIRHLLEGKYSRKTPVFPTFDTSSQQRCPMCA